MSITGLGRGNIMSCICCVMASDFAMFAGILGGCVRD